MKKALAFAALIGGLAVILGAFGAHALKEKLTPEALNSFETAVRYQMFHAIVLLFTNSYKEFNLKSQKILNILFFTGIIFFSGSIYTIYLANVPAKSIWFITPLGGILLTLGWLYMLFSFLKKK
ncbi:DUF423 domain-containing protein [Aureivirga sp. CE67]|uniref:DUF423 domain-containing protein n=1 Tax=Aureivirga sp. CE67 TaxID=1788983 RepID=UPI0018C97E55|nr:DUF423 domain-containing protein [Aureivirga sp. CE67]